MENFDICLDRTGIHCTFICYISDPDNVYWPDIITANTITMKIDFRVDHEYFDLSYWPQNREYHGNKQSNWSDWAFVGEYLTNKEINTDFYDPERIEAYIFDMIEYLKSVEFCFNNSQGQFLLEMYRDIAKTIFSRQYRNIKGKNQFLKKLKAKPIPGCSGVSSTFNWSTYLD